MRRSCLHKFSPFGSIHPHLYPHLCLPHKYSRHGSIHTLIPGSTPESSLVSPASPAIAMQLAQSTLSSLTSSHPHLHPHMYSYSLHPVSNGPYTRSCSLHSVRWFPCTRTHSTQCQMVPIHVHVLYIVSDGSLVHYTHFSYISYSFIHPHVLIAAHLRAHTHTFTFLKFPHISNVMGCPVLATLLRVNRVAPLC
jgi:hypothetical protein